MATPQIPKIMADLGIEVSTKPESSRPFSRIQFALGAHFDLTGARPTMLPGVEKIDKFERLLKGVKINEGKSISLRQMQEFTGMLEFFSRFTDLGFTPVSVAHECLRVPSRSKLSLCPVSKKLVLVSEDVLYRLRLPAGVPVTKKPFVWHFSKHGFNTDSRGLAKEMQEGWGGCVAGRCISGALSKSILQALKDEALSINPLELVVLAILFRCARQQKVIPQGAQVVWKCDNISAIANVNNDRANSDAMLEALSIVKETTNDTNITVHGQCISRRQVEPRQNRRGYSGGIKIFWIRCQGGGG